MDHPLRRPEEILAYRSLKEILAGKPKTLWTIRPRDNTLTAMHLMAEKNIGFLVVMDQGAIVGVLSERDCVRRLMLAGKSPEATAVADIMVKDVIKAEVSSTFAHCLKLMHEHRIRHLPVVETPSRQVASAWRSRTEACASSRTAMSSSSSAMLNTGPSPEVTRFGAVSLCFT
jgi:CBS-domain-containing membrane protein